ncbi:MAG TPA: type II CAAX endopeptidase family protein [Candidatus Limnocylindrales bacterium]
MTDASGGPALPDDGPGGDPPRPPLGLTTFTLEGRTAPALFLVGWLGTIVGLGATIVASFGARGVAGGILFLVGTSLLTIGLIAAAGAQTIERRAARIEGYSGPSPMLVFAASIALTLFLSVAVGTPLILLGLDADGPAAALIGTLFVFVSYFVLIRLLVVGSGALTWRDMGLGRGLRSIGEDAAWGIALAVPVLLASGLLARILSLFLPVEEPLLPPATDAPGILLNLLTAAVVAPIGEEMFFRGFATTAWARIYGANRALIQGALVFAAAHLLTLPAVSADEGLRTAFFTFLVRLPVALTLGWLFLRRRSLVAPIFLHGTFNGLQVLALAAASGALDG